MVLLLNLNLNLTIPKRIYLFIHVYIAYLQHVCIHIHVCLCVCMCVCVYVSKSSAWASVFSTIAWDPLTSAAYSLPVNQKDTPAQNYYFLSLQAALGSSPTQWGHERLVCGNRRATKGSELGTRCGCQGITPLAQRRTDTRGTLMENRKDPARGRLGMDHVWEGGRGNQGREGQAGQGAGEGTGWTPSPVSALGSVLPKGTCGAFYNLFEISP